MVRHLVIAASALALLSGVALAQDKRSTAAAMIRCELKMPAKDIHTVDTVSTILA